METFRPWIEVVLPPPCYGKVIEEQDFFNGDCMATAISKLLGFGIILGSILVKLPQILKIAAAQSGEGLSVLSICLELISFTSAASYGYRNQFPFSAYGENIFLMVQGLIILVLVLWYSRRHQEAVLYLAAFASTAYFLFSDAAPYNLIYTLQTANLPIVATSKLIQIFHNFSNESTGQLSFITATLLFTGAFTRILTSAQETGDLLLILNFGVATLCNGILFAQILYYWNSGSAKAAHHSKVKAS